jgi:excisionase family DNA binding protein
VVDIYIGDEERLIYSFYNPTRKNNIIITAASEKDKDNVHAKLKSDPTDIYWRQYFIRVAMDIVDIKKFDAKVSENMTAEEVANYLNLEIKTIRNWTSEGKIPSVKLGSAVRYQKERIDNWLKSNEKKIKFLARNHLNLELYGIVYKLHSVIIYKTHNRIIYNLYK